MGAFAAGSVVLIPFPFSDLSRTKLRPAVVLAALDKGDCILCQVTSQPYDSESVTLDQQDFAEGSLQRTSFARPGKLFTAHESLLQRSAGVLTPPALHTLREKVVQTIRGESPRTIKAIIWDFGGVLTSSPFESFNRFEAARGLPKDFIRGINATNPTTNAWARFEASRIGLEEFDELFAAETAAAGHRIGGREVIGLLYGEIRPRMVAAVRACRARYKVACITNNVKSAHSPGPVVDAARAAQIAAALAEFDLVVESSVEGVRKPDPRIYLLACERLGVQPAQAVFLDDLGVNLKPAAALGMRTIKVIDEAQALAELSALTGLTL